MKKLTALPTQDQPSQITLTAMQTISTLMNPGNAMSPLQSVGESFLKALPEGWEERVLGYESKESFFTSTEYQNIFRDVLTGVASVRPAYFEGVSVAEDDGEGSSAEISVFSAFLKEFTQGGGLDKWVESWESQIESMPDLTAEQKEGMQTFIQMGVSVLRYITDETFRDPAKDPLNEGLDPKIFAELTALESWLVVEENRGAPQFETKFQRYKEGLDKIQANRMRQLESMSQNLRTVVRKIAGSQQAVDAMSGDYEATRTAELKTFIENLAPDQDPYEPNQLRQVWEHIHRQDLGRIFYKIAMVEHHEKAKNYWLLLHLDAMQATPVEAQSRMPHETTAAVEGPNLGYAFSENVEYGEWASKDNVMTMADLVLDSLTYVTTFCKDVDMDKFLEDFMTYPHKDNERTFNPRANDHLMMPVSLFLLEHYFKTPFERSDGKTLTGELLKAIETKFPTADVQLKLSEIVKSILEEMKGFATQLHSLQPGQPASQVPPRVFGIGFNGEKFNRPSRSHHNQNEIVLGFSHAGRSLGATLLLSFTKYFMSSSDRPFPFEEYDDDEMDAIVNKHRGLVMEQLQNSIDFFKPILGQVESTYQRHFIGGYNALLIEFNEEKPFNQYSAQLQSWLRGGDERLGHWFRLPSHFVTQHPDDVSVVVQADTNETDDLETAYARELLFYLVCKRPISKIHPEAMGAIKAHFFSGQTPTDEEVDAKVSVLHSDLEDRWEEWVGKSFITFRNNHERVMEKSRKKINQQIKSLKKSLRKISLEMEGIRQEKEEAIKNLEQESLAKDQEKSGMANSPADLSAEDFDRFQKFFFNNKHVNQCVEPLFARRVGHTGFLPIFVSPTPARQGLESASGPLSYGTDIKYQVIAPCDHKCQLHALPHILIGDVAGAMSADQLQSQRETHGVKPLTNRF